MPLHMVFLSMLEEQCQDAVSVFPDMWVGSSIPHTMGPTGAERVLNEYVRM